MNTLVTRFVKNESGATAVEYGLIAALIATRYDKTARCFLAGIHLVAALIWLN
jgi:Flp/Fap pilin component